MSTGTYFIYENPEARVELALCLKRIIERSSHLVQTEEHPTIRKEIAIDLITANNISFGIIAYGIVNEDDINWIVERHDANELWDAEKFDKHESYLRAVVKDKNNG